MRRSPEVENNWNALLQALEGYSGYVRAVAFSLDGKLQASASDDKMIKLSDDGSGAVLLTLEVHAIVLALYFAMMGHSSSLMGDRYVPQFFPIAQTISRPDLPRSLSVKQQCVIWGVENILWLPFEHCLSLIVVHEGSLYGCRRRLPRTAK
jgi:hypothetical protein